MTKCGRSRIAASMACAILLLVAVPAYPSTDTEAGRKYTIARQRLADLKKSEKKKMYRSYWLDCIRTFEQVEKKYARSAAAGDACFDRAEIYRDLYQFNRHPKDLEQAVLSFGKCQSAYPQHAGAPGALHHIIELSLDHKKDRALAAETYARLSKQYPDSSWTAKANKRFNPQKRTVQKKQDGAIETEKHLAPVGKAAGKGTAGVVTSVRFWSGGAYTRIVIDQNKPVIFQAKELKKPDRLVFDFLNTRLTPSIDKEPIPVNDGILKQVRTSQYAPDTVRVVLDLASIKSYIAFPLHDPDRLVIDVTGEGGREPEPRVEHAEAGTHNKIENNGEPNTELKTEPQNTAPPVPDDPKAKNNTSDPLLLSRQMALKIKTIAIDAGHGGHDPGAIGKNGLREKTVTLDIAKRLSKLVKERLGCNVVMTRDRDVFVDLEARPLIAKSKDADLFVSIHVNANRKRRASGIETYIQGLNASDRDAMATAARENATTKKKLSELDTELKQILIGLKMGDDDEESIKLAHAVQGSLVSSVKPVQGRVVNLGVKRAFFYVLINTAMPSILAEVGFISNPEEEKMLRKEAYRQSIAEALFQGVKKYVESRSPQMMGI